MKLFAFVAIVASLGIGCAGSRAFPEAAALPARPTMPDPLLLADGGRIDTPAAWRRQREELKELLQFYQYGHLPPAPGHLECRELRAEVLEDGQVDFRLLQLSFGPGQACKLNVASFVPKTGRPVPAILNISFGATPGEKPEEAVGPVPAKGRSPYLDPAVAASTEFAPLLRRGYAVLAWNYQQAAADQPGNRGSGYFPHYPGYDWGTIACWAWSVHRVVDYVQTDPLLDASKIAVVGHSRLGKTALFAGAMDERIAVVVPNGSGCGGTGAFRYNGKERTVKEGLEELTAHFPHWFIPRLATFAHQVERLPYDQHFVIALVAPRPLLCNDALADPYANSNAMLQSYLHAKPVYEQLDQPDNLGIHFRPGGHALGPDDWEIILDFCDLHLRQKPVSTPFHQIPPPEALAADARQAD